LEIANLPPAVNLTMLSLHERLTNAVLAVFRILATLFSIPLTARACTYTGSNVFYDTMTGTFHSALDTRNTPEEWSFTHTGNGRGYLLDVRVFMHVDTGRQFGSLRFAMYDRHGGLLDFTQTFGTRGPSRI